MDSNTQKEPPMPVLCAAGCGFFANPHLDNLCSKCNRERQASEATANAIASTAAPAIASAQAAAAAPAQPPVSQPQQTSEVSAQALPQQSPTLPAIKPAPSMMAGGSSAVATEAQQSLSPKVLEAVTAAAAAAAAGDFGSPQQQEQQASAAAMEEGPPRRVQRNTNRCFSCNKKVGLTGFKCRCGFVFCGPHRLAEAHQCDFDWKATGREQLAQNNPLVTADRVTRF